MAYYGTINGEILEDIADAIREKIGESGTISPSEMASYVPNSYSAGDEGKVVSNGALVAQGSQTIAQNGTYDTTLKNEVIVNVSGGSYIADYPILDDIDGFTIRGGYLSHEYNHDCTIYAVITLVSIPSDYTKYVGVATQEATGYSHGYYTPPHCDYIILSGFGLGLNKKITDALNKKYALAISISKTNGEVSYYAHESFVGSANGSINTIGETVYGRRWYGNNVVACDYVACADKIHDQNLVLSNLQKLISAYNTVEPTIATL